jgi:hypothetical protein
MAHHFGDGWQDRVPELTLATMTVVELKFVRKMGGITGGRNTLVELCQFN